MRRLPLIIIPLLIITKLVVQGFNPTDSPHGKHLKISCSVCHTSDGWILDENNTFDHATTNFYLAGQHIYADCKACHVSLVFDEAGTNCIDCHDDMHQQTLGTSCERCHNEESWLVSNIYEIHQLGRFPLLGAHALADCQDCHHTESLLRFEPLGVECIDCHRQAYIATTFPDHQAAGYPTTCEECHNINAFEWNASGINHNFFPLVGGHAIDDCARCHNVNDFRAISPACISCHQNDYNSTSNPNHAAVNFSTDCATCHSTVAAWVPATFDHSAFFPLTGVHNINECVKCHIGGNYTTASSECYSCHVADYNSTKDPNHLTAGFSTNCEICHSTVSGWEPSTFDHDSYFPIYSGKHQGEWNTCVDCHTNSSNYSIFSCTDCHEHNKSKMDDEHDEVRNYVYLSSACFNCHPRGEEDD
jgi:hypothetical protein